MASPSQGKTGQSLGKASAELAWKLGLVVPSAALLHLPHPTPPLVGVSSPTTLTEVCLHTHPTHFLEVLLTVVSLSLLGLLSKPGLYHLVGKLQGPRAHTGEDWKVGTIKR